MSLTRATTGTSRGCTRRVMTCSGHADHEAIPDISDKVQANMASHMRGAPVMELHTMNEDSRSDEEVTTPTPKKSALKSAKIRTTDTTVLCKITWLHEVVCTSTGSLQSIRT